MANVRYPVRLMGLYYGQDDSFGFRFVNGLSSYLTVRNTRGFRLASRPIPTVLLHEPFVPPRWTSRMLVPRHVRRRGRPDELADVLVA